MVERVTSNDEVASKYTHSSRIEDRALTCREGSILVAGTSLTGVVDAVASFFCSRRRGCESNLNLWAWAILRKFILVAGISFCQRGADSAQETNVQFMLAAERFSILSFQG